VIVFVAAMAKSLSDGFKPCPFRLTAELVVSVGTVDNFAKQ
jgi:hypothetical protein